MGLSHIKSELDGHMWFGQLAVCDRLALNDGWNIVKLAVVRKKLYEVMKQVYISILEYHT